MKSNPNIDELLCSFIDGELPPRQKTEVQRMAARDPEVAQRLRQLQNCKTLVSVVPRAEAPGDMVEQIRLSLERRTLLGERPVSSNGRAGRWHLRIRRLTAAAAMIALLGGLGLVVYQIVAPVSPAGVPGTVANSDDVAPPPVSTTPPPVVVASGPGFSGRLELRTVAAAQAHSVISQAIKENGLSEMADFGSAGSTRTYHIACSREGLERLVADLGAVWQNSESAALIVETGRFNDSVTVEPITLQQTARIVSQDSAEASVAVAKEIAILDRFAQEMPGQNLVAAADEELAGTVIVPAIPKPKFTSDVATDAAPAEEGTVKATLTIVLVDGRS